MGSNTHSKSTNNKTANNKIKIKYILAIADSFHLLASTEHRIALVVLCKIARTLVPFILTQLFSSTRAFYLRSARGKEERKYVTLLDFFIFFCLFLPVGITVAPNTHTYIQSIIIYLEKKQNEPTNERIKKRANPCKININVYELLRKK